MMAIIMTLMGHLRETLPTATAYEVLMHRTSLQPIYEAIEEQINAMCARCIEQSLK